MNTDTEKTKVHFVDNYLLAPTNPITVNLIGAGGTGSKVLTGLMEINESLLALGHPGLQVRLWDDDIVTSANLGRQRFFECEVGLPKSVALINRINRCTGANWKAETLKFERDKIGNLPKESSAIITMTCVDTVQARFGVAEILTELERKRSYTRDFPRYWIDFGNSRYSGQAILSTVGDIRQQSSEKYIPIANLPFVTEEYGDLLLQSEKEDNTPSCSLAEALEQQDLFINASLAQMGCKLFWSLFRNGMIKYKGFFHNLADFRTTPILIG
ncbi:PRTRC system ThiF family protein [Chryseobacterium sp. 2987]|uniref:PRTRC system ThiF family protein n=1 Tax=Chryseobacterium sp. 2987 TaxID=2817767 RepID=UPI00285CD5D2|nr:PRTRC system ThiF family protein [Chryseobacterium sp. 2987]MDR6919534.1 PRTRC genetic system ThiF family protein [Chryseobacterium sp. 2987]